ncbi:MAG: Maf-like protein [Prevotellaceae bacterium]|jgi:septum formation protein|nr:Maf-like protein [Prevotellaceae bacterium]
MLDHLKKYRIILASGSPRRKELLSGLNIPFEVRLLENVSESYPNTLQKGDIPLYIAKEKADAYRPLMQADDLLITADTIVWLEGEVLEKPADKQEAAQMLHRLSGRTHEVYTAVCLTTADRQQTFEVCTQVRFASLSDEEIAYYVTAYAPLDKAGAYGVQEWIGYIGVEEIIGDYYNIMGLPLCRLYQELLKF